jgi:hypothetical protein
MSPGNRSALGRTKKSGFGRNDDAGTPYESTKDLASDAMANRNTPGGKRDLLTDYVTQRMGKRKAR